MSSSNINESEKASAKKSEKLYGQSSKMSSSNISEEEKRKRNGEEKIIQKKKMAKDNGVSSRGGSLASKTHQ